MLKRILVVGFCIGLMGCDDDAIVYPPDVKETVATELKNTVWKPTYAASNESGTHKQESLSQAFSGANCFSPSSVGISKLTLIRST